MKAIATILLFIAGITLLVFVAQPLWGVVGQLRADDAEVSNALSGLNKTKDIQDEITGAYNALDNAQLDSLLQDHLPAHAATGPFLIAIEQMARDNRVVVSNIDFKETPKQTQDALRKATSASGSADSRADVDELPFSMTITGSYDQFKAFLSALEHYIRIVDINSISFASQDRGVYQFTISAKTYYRQ